LRGRYVTALRRYEGTRYVWGGENRFGIDCSGLVRRGLIDANLHEGIATLNPGRIRAAARLWWYDCSARALRDGYRDWTRLLFTAPAINDIVPDRLSPGDIAVTANGVHVLVYLGENQWMQADPKPGKVVRQAVPVAEGGWFEVPVHVMRWQQIDDSDVQ
jgi:cell wall-associated NlpC family hydrolase